MELLSLRRSFYLINEMKALVKNKKKKGNAFCICIGNDLCDQLSVADGLSWFCRPSPELILTSA